MASSSKRFCDVDIQELIASTVNQNTEKAKKHAWNLFIIYCHDSFSLDILDSIKEMPVVELDNLVSKFSHLFARKMAI